MLSFILDVIDDLGVPSTVDAFEPEALLSIRCHTPTIPAAASRYLSLCFWCAGLFPSAVQMFVVFPNATPFGIGGVGLGKLTPLFVIIFNTLGWSMPGYFWFRLAGTAFPLC